MSSDESKLREKMRQAQKEVHEQMDTLLEEGHACLFEQQSYPSQLKWCESSSCEDNPNPTFLLKNLPRSICVKFENKEPKLITIKRLRHDTCKELIPYAGAEWQNWITRFICDYCSKRTDPGNPIYTHADYRDVDICSECVHKVTQRLGLKPYYSIDEFSSLSFGSTTN